MGMRISVISFSQSGAELASRIASSLELEGDAVTCTRGFGEDKVAHADWTSREWGSADALVYVGAAGIAVRSIAPHVVHKTVDPAVIVVDERGFNCISLLSGHIGGANGLALRIARGIGANPVITTATDVNGVFAVDSWATSQGMVVLNPEKIKDVSSALLRGDDVKAWSEFPIAGETPSGVLLASDAADADFAVVARKGMGSGADAQSADVQADGDASDGDGGADAVQQAEAAETGCEPLMLVPRALVLGVGCRRGTPRDAIEERFTAMCDAEGLEPSAFSTVATIDVKADEEGLIAFCESRGLEMRCFTADELNAQAGDFHSSDFVKRTVGTDNVCERAVAAAGGSPLVGRSAENGVTLSAGILPVELAWP